jgi:hypothetical protein
MTKKRKADQDTNWCLDHSDLDQDAKLRHDPEREKPRSHKRRRFLCMPLFFEARHGRPRGFKAQG